MLWEDRFSKETRYKSTLGAPLTHITPPRDLGVKIPRRFYDRSYFKLTAYGWKRLHNINTINHWINRNRRCDRRFVGICKKIIHILSIIIIWSQHQLHFIINHSISAILNILHFFSPFSSLDVRSLSLLPIFDSNLCSAFDGNQFHLKYFLYLEQLPLLFWSVCQ